MLVFPCNLPPNLNTTLTFPLQQHSTHTLKQKERRNENKERDESRGDPRERKRASGEELSAPPSRIATAEPRRRRHWGRRASSRHWDHRAVTVTIGSSSRQFHREESSRERGVTSREREIREEGEFCPTVAATVASWGLCCRSSVAIHGVAGVHRHREEERHAEGEPTGERKRRRVCCEPAIVTIIATCHRRCEPLLLPFNELCSVAVLPPLEPLGIVYHELLRRTPPSEPSFRCCPLALSRSNVAASVVIVAARFSLTSLVCSFRLFFLPGSSRRYGSLVAVHRLVVGFWFISVVLPL
ncbi:uncharacterized protein DS421_1g11430 [Arachis hypogaea]|nr:uncharacterized protein DS421_1g11430 [Arachis hypogaea]